MYHVDIAKFIIQSPNIFSKKIHIKLSVMPDSRH